jgi:hypothetical protein
MSVERRDLRFITQSMHNAQCPRLNATDLRRWALNIVLW